MNPHSRHLQPGQTRFGGYRLLHRVESQASGIDSWLAEQHGGHFLLHVLPLTRSLTEAEKAPLHKLRHLGQRAGRSASRMTLRDVCEEEGREPATALVEAFPPLPEGSAEWLNLPAWTALHGAATTGLVAGHLPRLGQMLSELPGGQHGSLTAEKTWLAAQGEDIHAVILSLGALADFHLRVPELSSAVLTPDVQGLGQVLYTWLTGLLPGEKAHTRLIKDLNAAHKGAARTPEHWQRLIVSSMDADPGFHPPSVRALIDSLLHPIGSATAATPGPVKPPQDSFWPKAAAVITVGALGLTFMSWVQSDKALPEVVEPKQAPQAPTFDPPAPVPDMPKAPAPGSLLPPVLVDEETKPLPVPVPVPVPPPTPAQPEVRKPVVVVPKPAEPTPEAQPAPPRAPPLLQTYHPPRLLPQPVPTPTPAPALPPQPPQPPRPIKPPEPEVVEVKPEVIKAVPISQAVAVVEGDEAQEHEQIVRAIPLEPGEEFSAQPQTFEALSLSPPPLFNLDEPPALLRQSAPIPWLEPAPAPIYIPPSPWEWALPIFEWRPWKALQPTPPQRQPSRARVSGQPDLPLWWRELPR